MEVDRQLQVSAWLTVGLVALVPLAFDPWGLQQRTPIAALLILAVVPMSLGLMLGRKSIPLHPSLVWMAGLLAALSVGAAFGSTPFNSLIGSPARMLGLIGWAAIGGALWLGLCMGQVSGMRERLDRTFVVGSLPVSFIALFERGDRLLDLGAGDSLVRSQSTLRNPVFLGAYLVLCLPIALALMVDREVPKAWRASAGLAFAVGTLALLLSQSRGAWLGALAGLSLVAVHVSRHRSRRVCLAVGAFALIAGVLVMASPLRDRALSVGNTTRGSNAIRVELWQAGLRLVADRPVTGYGPDATASAIPSAISESFENTVTRRQQPDRIHNALLDVAVWGGIPALIAFLGLLGCIALGLVRHDPKLGTRPIGMAGALVGYVVQWQVGFPLADLDVLALLLAGVALAPQARRRQLPDGIGPALRATFVIAGLLAGGWQARAVAADHILGRAVQAESSGAVAKAEQLYRRATERTVERAHAWQAQTRFGLRMNDAGHPELLDQSERASSKALALVPKDPSYRIDRAEVLLAIAIRDEQPIDSVLDFTRRILDDDPWSSAAWFVHANALATAGSTQQAAAAWEKSANLAAWATGPRVNLGRLADLENRAADALRWFTEAIEIDSDEPTAKAWLATAR